jgi:PAS domain S-box-containing protein
MSSKPSYEELVQQVNELQKQIAEFEREKAACHEQETRDILIQKSLPMAFYIAYPYGDYGGTWVSDQIEMIAGFKPEQFMDDKGLWAARLHPEDKQRALQNFAELTDQETIELEYRWQVADGSYKWFRDTAAMSRDEEGNPREVIGTWLDITEFRHLQDEIFKSNQRFKELAELLPQIVYETDMQGNLTYVNRQAFEVTGYLPEDLEKGFNVLSMVAEEDRSKTAENIKNILAGKTTDGNEYKLVRKDGTFFSTIAYSSPILEHGEPTGLRGIIVDISELKEAEKALQESKQNYKNLSREFRALLDAIPDSLTLHDSDLRIIWVNRWAADRMGMAVENIIGRHCYELFHGQQEPCRDCPTIRCMQSGMIEEGQVTDKDGTIWNMRSIPLQEDDGNATRVIELGREITEHRKIENALHESEERYRTLFENATDAIQVVQPDGKLLYVNPSWCNALGYSEKEAVNLKIYDIIHPDCKHECEMVFHMAVSEGSTGNIETVFKSKDGRKVLLEGSANCKYNNGKPAFVHCIFRDVTEKRKIEEELIKAHKLESVGILAGGIAHDFNNILTALIGNLSLARMHAKPGEKVYKRIEEAEKATSRARDLTQQLLTFAKGGEPIKQLMSVSGLVKDTSEFVLRGSNVICEYDLADDLWPVEADEGQISQVIHNLVINADHAMPEGGKITILAENVHINSKEPLPIKDGDYVVVSVEDHGSGISKKHLARVFDPYFSTKHKGHGLGLTTSYSIIKNHGGLLVVESELGTGTVFRFYLPASKKKQNGQAEAVENIHVGKGSILLMDDEEDVREIAKEMLTHLGYEVMTAVDGRQAIDLYSKAKEDDAPFDAVIMDLTVPGGMGGKETIEKLLEMSPSVKAIVSSGYANDPIMANYQEYGFSGVVPKPYRIEDVSLVLQDLFHSN